MSVAQSSITAKTGTAPVVDIDALLAPISADKPAGESVQYSGVYDEIREARRSDDSLNQGEWKRETKVPYWDEVIEISVRTLGTKTKDLQIAAWLTEALVKMHGFAGLRDGLKVIQGFHEQFWEGLFPEQDEGDLEARANAISWLERQCATAVKQVPITGRSTGIECTFNDLEDANSFNVGPDVESSVAAERRKRAAEENKITSEEWMKAKESTPRAFYEIIFADINQSWETFAALDRLVDERFQRQTPGMGSLKNSLDQVRSAVEKIVKEKRELEPDPISEQPGPMVDPINADVSANGDGTGGSGARGVSGPIRTRQDAVNRLKEVAAFFRQTEPQSPVSYLVERAIKWSEMPLESWLASVIKDTSVLDKIKETLGVDSNE
jgi:type VI secretion system protein ImpA